MDKVEWIIAYDPSGNFSEGKGETGICIFNCTQNAVHSTLTIKASDYECAEEYWYRHIELLDIFMRAHKNAVISMEDYQLYAGKAAAQVHSKFETVQLIGIIKMHCFLKGYKLYMRPAVTVKKRWSDEILTHHGYLPKQLSGTPLVSHEVDAIRHAVHTYTFEIRS